MFYDTIYTSASDAGKMAVLDRKYCSHSNYSATKITCGLKEETAKWCIN